MTALVLALFGAGAFRCADGPSADARPSASGTGSGAAAPTSSAPAEPQHLTGAELPGPTGLRLLIPGWFLDVDARASRRVAVTRWLPRLSGAPILLDEASQFDGFGRVRISMRAEAGLPGTARVVRVSGPAVTTVAVSADGAGLWVGEYHSRTSCTLREVGLDGRERRPGRAVACGTRPASETADGLWVTVGPDAFKAATETTSSEDYTSVLLDPATLTERARFARAEPLDEHRFIVVTNRREDPLELRDLRTGQVRSLPRPPYHGWPDPLVGSLSPDGRYLPFTFGEPGTMPQVMDVWLLDLLNLAWLHVPSMPVYAALKGTGLAWATDGRLVLLGQFFESGREPRGMLVTWRPGDPALRLLPYERPPASDSRFHVW